MSPDGHRQMHLKTFDSVEYVSCAILIATSKTTKYRYYCARPAQSRLCLLDYSHVANFVGNCRKSPVRSRSVHGDGDVGSRHTQHANSGNSCMIVGFVCRSTKMTSDFNRVRNRQYFYKIYKLQKLFAASLRLMEERAPRFCFVKGRENDYRGED